MEYLVGRVLFELGNRFSALSSIVGYGKWDKAFRQWIKVAEAKGVDPNDIGDDAWANDYLSTSLDKFYLAYVPEGGTVLELGPGTGRLTRHLIGKASRIELIDNSRLVVNWMRRYLSGKVDHRAERITSPRLSHLADGSVDTVLAHGVFEHLDFDETYWFLAEFHRVLKVSGHISFNYDSIVSPGGANWFLRHKGEPGTRCIFRFYTPELMARLAELAGLKIVQSHSSAGRFAHLIARKEAAFVSKSFIGETRSVESEAGVEGVLGR